MAAVSSLLLFFWTSCSLKAKDQKSKLYIDLSQIVGEARHEATTLSDRFIAGELLLPIGLVEEGDIGIFAVPSPAPSLVQDFVCIGINVVGPGIASNTNNLNGSGNASTLAQNLLNPSSVSCSYRGTTAGPILKGADGLFSAIDLNLVVPAGANRVIQVVGVVNDPNNVVCQPGGFPDGPGGNSEGAWYYEISRAIIPNLFNSQSITLPNTWPTASASERAKRLVNCGDSA